MRLRTLWLMAQAGEGRSCVPAFVGPDRHKLEVECPQFAQLLYGYGGLGRAYGG